MNDFSPAGHPLDPVGRFATKPLAESGPDSALAKFLRWLDT